MNLLLATTKQDKKIHVVHATPSGVYTTLCGQQVADIRPIQTVPDEMACEGCAAELNGVKEQLEAVRLERDRLRNALRRLADAVDEPWRSELHDALDESAAVAESSPARES